jgi:deoxyribodipyrimidine photo-lyase
MPDPKVLIYVMRRDLRVSDNPILHSLSSQEDHSFTHLLPLYVFAAQQLEISGFIEGDARSPYPEARSQIGGFWRCGPHRAKFLSESVWDLKGSLEKLGSGLCVRVGMVGEVVKKILEAEGSEMKVGGVWMTGEEGVEEGREERGIKDACEKNNVDFKLWVDEKYLVDEFAYPTLPSFTSYITTDTDNTPAAISHSKTPKSCRISTPLTANPSSL